MGTFGNDSDEDKISAEVEKLIKLVKDNWKIIAGVVVVSLVLALVAVGTP